MGKMQELNYLELCERILDNGIDTTDRTGVGTLSLFGEQLRFNLQDGFPAITTKKLAWRSVVAELLWFIEGSGDERRLAEIQFGTRDKSKKTIWSANATADYWVPKARFDGDLGRVYGVQWRKWKNSYGREIDQLEELIKGLKNDPHSRRHIVSAWNPGELDKMALPPCHAFMQFYLRNNRLSCQMYQRSGDVPLGIPFNIASYSFFTHMIAHVCKFEVGEFIHVIGDAHIYKNQIEGIQEQLTRKPLPLPKLWLNPNVTDITKFTMDDIKLIDYQSHPAINFPFAT